MDVQVTVDDSKTYTSQWNMPVMRYTYSENNAIGMAAPARNAMVRGHWPRHSTRARRLIHVLARLRLRRFADREFDAFVDVSEPQAAVDARQD